jgi:predicted 3-demethylubiquinone-9 3-methyltransferase (glyoxalase superfamily)
MQITPSWVFNNRAEEAVNFYVSIFKDSKIVMISHYGEGDPGPAGTVSTIGFQLLGQNYFAANGGDHFTFSQGLSLYVNCENQEEIDYLWERLSEGGEKQVCGWVVDKFGVSWQIAPTVLEKMLREATPAQ